MTEQSSRKDCFRLGFCLFAGWIGRLTQRPGAGGTDRAGQCSPLGSEQPELRTNSRFQGLSDRKASQRTGDEAGTEAVARAGCVDDLGRIARAAPNLCCLIGVKPLGPIFRTTVFMPNRNNSSAISSGWKREHSGRISSSEGMKTSR